MAGEMHLKTKQVVNLEKHKMYRDPKTGRFIARKDIGQYLKIKEERSKKEKQKAPNSPLGEKIVEAVREQGIEVNTIEEVWAKLIGIQAEIALDKTNGAKATAAAKLVAQVMGTMDGDSPKEDGTDMLVLGRELAKEILALIEKEK